VYFDSSALVKLLLDERGSEWSIDVWDEAATPLTSAVAYVEVRAALAAAARADRVDAAQLRSARDRFEKVWSEIGVLECGSELIRHAGDVAESAALRGYDAIHLSSALTLHAAQPLYMLTWDSDLAEASFDAGLNVIRTSGT
jgi:predicted nucleic acid-binding protein